MRTNLLRSAALFVALAAPFAAPAAFAQSENQTYAQTQAQSQQPAQPWSNVGSQPIASGHGWNSFIHETPEGVVHYGSEDYGFQGRSSQY